MISVCIPVYNVNIHGLAGQLMIQAEKLGVPVEILCFDDGSDEKFRIQNGKLKTTGNFFYKEFPENMGRASIRNALGEVANHPWLLFLDADSELEKGDFLEKYVQAIDSEDVICGGTTYEDTPPSDRKRLLRWTYGKKREQLSAAQRRQKDKFAITANNFMIRKRIFLECPFRTAIRGYGHEDTVLGYDISHAGYKINHIDNPVRHTGLETSREFLDKTRYALGNLVFISGNIIRDSSFIRGSGLLRLGNSLKRSGLLPLVRYLFTRIRPLLERNLTGSNPRLLFFDLYRIGYLSTLIR